MAGFLQQRRWAAVTAQHTQSLEQKKRHAAEQIWLHYYNQTLFEKGLITETERNRMKNLINGLAPSTTK